MPAVRTGAARLVSQGFVSLAGRRVGLITNHTGLVGKDRLIDLLAASPDARLTAILVPEHGLAGAIEAGAAVKSTRDAGTGAPVFSLYGATQKPTPEMLRGLDVLAFDIQDIGVRAYTYISTMGLAMQSAAAAGLPFVVLDRPNPMGGEYVSGFVLEDTQRSFVGQFAIPMAHGLSVGELALLIKGERLLPGLDKLKLSVERMAGWTRSMRWPDTGLPWVATSPNIPDYETALVYAGAVLFEATSASDGRGTATPFRVLGAPWANGRRLTDRLEAERLPGVAFRPTTFTPRPIKGMASNPRLQGQALHGIEIVVAEHRSFLPVETGMHVLAAFAAEASASAVPAFIDKAGFLARLAGTARLQRLLERGAGGRAIVAAWKGEVERFRAARGPYLLY